MDLLYIKKKVAHLTNIREDCFYLNFLNGKLEISFTNNNEINKSNTSTTLDLSFIKEVTSLRELHSIFINGYTIKNIESIIEANQLSVLSLIKCSIDNIGFIEYVENLEELNVSSNNIASLDSLNRLTKLKYLDVSNNNLTSIKNISFLVKNNKLNEFYFQNNQIDFIPKIIYELSYKNMFNAKSRNILFDQIAMQSRRYGHQDRDKFISKIETQNDYINAFNELFFLSNPITSPPLEIIKLGEEFVKSWYDRYNKEITKGTQALNEAKLVLIGEPSAGKTSLVDYLLDKPYGKTVTTNGVNLDQWYVLKKGEKFRINIWDFGGQEIQSAVHQFFLTKDTLYIIVLNARQDAQFAERYIEQIKSFAPNSPIIIVINKIDENANAKIEENRLKETYKDKGNEPLIKHIHKISLLEGHKRSKRIYLSQLNRLKRDIISELIHLPNISKKVPITYINVKDHIEIYFKNIPYISFESYERICLENNLSIESNEDLLYYLDILGTIRYFDDFRIRHLQILKPEWLTSGIYRIITSEFTSRLLGILKASDLEKILIPVKKGDFIYPKQYYQFLIEMIQIFNIGYFNIESQTIFIPYAFSSDYPKDLNIDEYKVGSIHFYYEYKGFIPPVLISSFIAQVFKYVKNNLFWYKGIVIEKQELGQSVTALVIENPILRRIDIWVQGSHRRDFFIEIRSIFNALHESRKGLEVEELISLDDNENISVKYKLLIMYLLNKETMYMDEKGNKYRVDRLLGMFETDQYLLSIVEKIDTILEKTKYLENLIKDASEKIDSINQDQAKKLLKDIDEQFALMPAKITKEWKEINKKPADYREVKSKLKVTLPLIPSILFLETEVSIDIRNTLRKILEDFRNGIYLFQK